MRQLPLLCVAALVVAASGCQPLVLAPVDPSGALDCKALFATLDQNGDGILTEAEYVQGRPLVQVAFPTLKGASDAQLSAHLKGFDANQDGKIDPDEFVRACAATASPKPSPAPSTSPSACLPCPPLVAWDGNGDGVVSLDEFLAARGGQAGDRERLGLAFGAFDLNGDGRIDASELCGPLPSARPSEAPAGSPSPKPSGSPSAKPSEGPSASPSPRPSPSPSAKPSDACGGRFATFDANADGAVGDEEYFLGKGGTQANKDAIALEFKGLDANGDGRLSLAEFCPAWPSQATVKVYGPMQPFGPQSVDIAAGGTVLFNNVNSGVAWTIRSVAGPGFPDLPLPTSPSSATTVALTAPGTYEYKIDGANPIVAHGFIVVH